LQRLEDQHIPLTKDVIQVDNKNDERNKLNNAWRIPGIRQDMMSLQKWLAG
jgi:hypothetical protein